MAREPINQHKNMAMGKGADGNGADRPSTGMKKGGKVVPKKSGGKK